MESKKITLAGMAGGAVEERFGLELEAALRNIHNPMTSSTKKREITIKVSLTPNKDRSEIDVEVVSSSKLSAVVGVETRFYTALRPDGTPDAAEHNPKQLMLDVAQPPIPSSSVTGLGTVVGRFGQAGAGKQSADE